MEEMEEEGRDLDDEVPDAEVEVTALEGDTEDEEESEEDEVQRPQFRDDQQFRQVLMRGEEMVMDQVEEEEDPSALLQEEDLVGYEGGQDLDDEIPDAETEGYEHTVSLFLVRRSLVLRLEGLLAFLYVAWKGQMWS